MMENTQDKNQVSEKKTTVLSSVIFPVSVSKDSTPRTIFLKLKEKKEEEGKATKNIYLRRFPGEGSRKLGPLGMEE
jgi:hypothetical protein